VLVAGGDQLVVAAHGRLVLPEAVSGQDRRLRHERGRILVHIESRRDRDVRVNTPLLSLGIKGTNFEVDVNAEHDSVVVHDGEVQVTTPDQAEPVDLGAGKFSGNRPLRAVAPRGSPCPSPKHPGRRTGTAGAWAPPGRSLRKGPRQRPLNPPLPACTLSPPVAIGGKLRPGVSRHTSVGSMSWPPPGLSSRSRLSRS
jgi:hypothetical protein